jgi:hypothetical protein
MKKYGVTRNGVHIAPPGSIYVYWLVPRKGAPNQRWFASEAAALSALMGYAESEPLGSATLEVNDFQMVSIEAYLVYEDGGEPAYVSRDQVTVVDAIPSNPVELQHDRDLF